MVFPFVPLSMTVGTRWAPATASGPRGPKAVTSGGRVSMPAASSRATPRCPKASGRFGVRLISMDPPDDKVADIARQMGAELVRRPT